MDVAKLEGDYAWVVRTQGCRSKSVNSDREKYARDYFLLKGYLEKDPNQPRKQFYAAQSAFDAQLYDVAEKEYLKRAELGSWPEEVFFSWMRIGICRDILGRPIAEIADAYLKAFDIRPNRAEPLYHLSCIYRKYNRPKNAFLIAHLGLHIPVPQNDILFVDNANYLWGIFDEVATTAFYAGMPQVGMQCCQKLLGEPYLPAEHRERVQNNMNIYSKAFNQFQVNLEQQQKEWATKIAKETNKTTLNVSPKAATVKL
jgi:hypothetical protein